MSTDWSADVSGGGSVVVGFPDGLKVPPVAG